MMTDLPDFPRDEDGLFNLLRSFDDHYYSNVAVISDDLYDALREKARTQFPNNPYWETVGATPPSHLSKSKLTIHMGSQNKAHTEEEVLDWMKKNVIGDLLMMDKADGSSVELTYRNGVLIRAITRGDGEIGSVVTENARKWRIPTKIDITDTIIIRGEAILGKPEWENLDCFKGTANPRNAGNGTVMRKDGENNEHIRFLAFNLEKINDGERFLDGLISTRLAILQDLGFEVVRYYTPRSFEELVEFRKEIIDGRSSLSYEIDGLILSENNILSLEQMGYSDGGTRPRGQIAWKFEAETAVSKVIDVEITMGHTGAIIPTIKIEPVQIGGVTVGSVLGNNFTYLSELNLNIGDEILVSRAGDVIPHVEKVLVKNSDGPYSAPDTCPFCGTPLVVEGKATRCSNEECEGLAFQKLRNWVNKLDIKHLGDSLLETLYNQHGIGSIAHLYEISGPEGTAQFEWLSQVQSGAGRLGKKMASKITAEIERTRKIPIDLLMGSLSIKFLGRSMAQHIGFDTVEEWLEATPEELSTKENMGINKAREMKASIERARPVINSLVGILTILPCSKKKPAANGSLSGTVVCLTGVRMTADEKDRFAALGGVEKSGVSSGVTHLVQKSADSESSKSKKAISLGIKVIGIEEFRAMLS